MCFKETGHFSALLDHNSRTVMSGNFQNEPHDEKIPADYIGYMQLVVCSSLLEPTLKSFDYL